jgi:hypothetical protein
MTIWEVGELPAVEDECAAIKSYLAEQFLRDEHLGYAEPPRTVNEEADAEPFGRRLALDLLDSMIAFIDQARGDGSNIYAHGD